ncbi:hypothetical protein [Streptomyces decoyicus]|uniref:hypothetical protein n=1 Tax=Streptomyces decoyicus TaxID=249567 RepID=UPI0033A5EB06
MSDTPARPAMTVRQIREGLGHIKPGEPNVLVTITRYEVSVLPADDINRRYFVLFVELTRRGAWVITDGHGGYDRDGGWTPGRDSGIEYADVEEALALARRLAPALAVNGHTATDAYRRTQA